MMRYFNIFIIYSQLAIEVKSLSVVWFFTSLIGPLLMLIFWNSATASQGGSILGWTYSNFATYYLLIVFASSLLLSHIEGRVAEDHIKQGELTNWLLKPVSYFLVNFVTELPWRFIQGSFAIIAIVFFAVFTQGIVEITASPLALVLAVVSAILAYLLSFLFKMCLAFLAFWFTEISGIMLIVEIIFEICGGIIIPLLFLPSGLQAFLNMLPFPYMIYYPILSILGKLNTEEQLKIIMIQVVWILIFTIIYKFLWKKGIKQYAAIGR